MKEVTRPAPWARLILCALFFPIRKRLKTLTLRQIGAGAARSCSERLTLVRLCADRLCVVLPAPFTLVTFLDGLLARAGASREKAFIHT